MSPIADCPPRERKKMDLCEVLTFLLFFSRFSPTSHSTPYREETVIFISQSDEFGGHKMALFDKIIQDTISDKILPSLDIGNNKVAIGISLGIPSQRDNNFKTVQSLTTDMDLVRLKLKQYIPPRVSQTRYSGLSSSLGYLNRKVFSKRLSARIVVVLAHSEVLGAEVAGFVKSSQRKLVNRIMFVVFPWPNQDCGTIKKKIRKFRKMLDWKDQVICGFANETTFGVAAHKIRENIGQDEIINVNKGTNRCRFHTTKCLWFLPHVRIRTCQKPDKSK